MEALQWKLPDNPKVSIPEIPIFRPELFDRTGLNLVFGPVFWASTNTTSQKPYHYARLEPNRTKPREPCIQYEVFLNPCGMLVEP